MICFENYFVQLHSIALNSCVFTFKKSALNINSYQHWNVHDIYNSGKQKRIS